MENTPQPQHTETFTQKLKSQKRLATGVAALLPLMQDMMENGTISPGNTKMTVFCLLVFAVVTLLDDARKTWRDVELAKAKMFSTPAPRTPLERTPTIPEPRRQ